MSATRAARFRRDTVTRALARDRLGLPAVLFFVLAGVAPLTVAAGVIPTAYQTTGLTGIPAAFLAVAVILAVFAAGYVAMARHIQNAGAFYAFVSQGIGRVAGVAAALVALLAYSCLQVGLYGAVGPAAQAEAAAHLGVHAPWWAWALAAWLIVAVLGLLRVDIAGRVLGVLLTIEILVIVGEAAAGLAHWAMAVHAGPGHVVAAAARQGPGLLFGLGGAMLSATAQLLFLTSLFAAALAFHNCTWRYMFALGREHVLPAALGRTGANNIPKAASLLQSATGLVVIVFYAATGQDPMARLFFWLGTTGGLGILLLLVLTAVAVVAFFARDRHGESGWATRIAPLVSFAVLVGIVVLAVRNYSTLLGVAPSDPAAWALPASYAMVAVAGVGWGLLLRRRRPDLYAAVGLGADAVTARLRTIGGGDGRPR